MIINILKAYEAGELLVESLISSYLQRIVSEDGAFKAVIHINNNAVNEAKKLDVFSRKNKKLKGCLHGIPVIIKANIKTNDDILTSCGSILLENIYANENASIVDWLHHEGAVIIGKRKFGYYELGYFAFRTQKFSRTDRLVRYFLL